MRALVFVRKAKVSNHILNNDIFISEFTGHCVFNANAGGAG